MANTEETKVNPFIPNGGDDAAMGTTTGAGTSDEGARPEVGEGDEGEPDGTDGTEGGGV